MESRQKLKLAAEMWMGTLSRRDEANLIWTHLSTWESSQMGQPDSMCPHVPPMKNSCSKQCSFNLSKSLNLYALQETEELEEQVKDISKNKLNSEYGIF